MINWDELLKEVLKDPVFADVKPTQHRISSSDRLVRSFEEIIAFVEEYGRVPSSSGNIKEKGLHRRLEGIKTDRAKYDKCKPYDRLNLLDDAFSTNGEEGTPICEDEEKSIDEQLADILKDPIFNISPEVEAIFTLPDYMQKDIERAKAEYIGKHVKCEDFEQFKPLFDMINRELKENKRRLIKFKEAHLQEGRFFVVSGVLVYLAKIHKLQKDSNHKVDGRTRCIYDNGTESDILLRTLGKSLFIDGYTVSANVEEEGFLEQQFNISDKDIATGCIYVLKSKSTDPDITKYRNLYKIGFTRGSVEERIANAKNEATYLYADVEIVATWDVYNVKSNAVEDAIHQLFDKVQLQVTVNGHKPKEWYVVPLRIIDEAINILMAGKKAYYDITLQTLITEE